LRLKQDTPVEVTWRDTESDPGWHPKEVLDAVEPPVCKTIGYYHCCRRVRGKVKWIVVKSSIDQKNQHGDYTVIPYGSIEKITRV
jgi:hypothetical protein